ncbi:MAG TPA: LysM domain-containing protein [Anaerolineaceae bacterium]|nr:LysM domain-containing protein [Anaerolineaceae bacterium]
MSNHVNVQRLIGLLLIAFVLVGLVAMAPAAYAQGLGQQQTQQPTQQAATQGATQQSGGTQQAQQGCGDQYVVRKGDTLGHIALRCNTTVAALLSANADITDRSFIRTGQKISIPQGQNIPVTGGGGIWAGLTADMAPPRFGGRAVATGQAQQQATQQPTQQGGQQATQQPTQQATQQATREATATQQPTQGVTQQPTATHQPTQGVTQQPTQQGQQATQQPTQQGQQTGGQTYTVQQGDTLASIAARLGITEAQLLQANPQLIKPGDVLKLPAGVQAPTQQGQQGGATQMPAVTATP